MAEKSPFLVLILGALLAVLLLARMATNVQAQSVTVSAMVLEHLTYTRQGHQAKISTNLDSGYWITKLGQTEYITPRF